MVETERFIHETGLAISSAGGNTHSRTLPKVPMKKIIIKVGTAITVSAGTVVANTSVKQIKVRYAGKEIIDITGQSYDDQASMGILMLREWNKQRNIAADPDDYFIIDLPTPLPANDMQITFTNQSAENIGADASETVTAGDHDIVYDKSKTVPTQAIVPYITSLLYSHSSTATSFYIYIPAIPFRLRAIVFCTHDGGVLADDTYDTILIHDRATNRQIFEGSLTDLKSQQASRSGVALATGVFLVWFPEGITVQPESLLFRITAGTGGTAKFVEMLLIAW